MSSVNLVVGGGIAGIVTAILAAQKFPQTPVYLIEKESSVGGLLRSTEKAPGLFFDYGSHCPVESTNQALNELLYADLNDDFYAFKTLAGGSYFAGQYFNQTQLLNATSTSYAAQALSELRVCTKTSQFNTGKSLSALIKNTYGETVAKAFIGPIMQKLMGATLEDLHPNAHLLFGLNRLVLGSADQMRELKQEENFDRVLGFASFREGISPYNKYYPKNHQGIDLWTQRLFNKAESVGVKVLTGVGLQSLDIDNGQITCGCLDQGQKINIKHLYWTIPPFLLLKLGQVNYQPAYRPSFRKTQLAHFVVDKPFCVDNYHIYCWEPSMSSFRITLYNNIPEHKPLGAPFKCTVELMMGSEKPELTQDEITQELITMGIIDTTHQVTQFYEDIIPVGFPAYTIKFVEELQNQHQAIVSALKNVSLFGKASAKNFFMHYVLNEIHQSLS
ncbi:NAD(P)-binding protein [Algicola sagamiensis]|uniref:NAD(P)-binding protein n=1 Tax=Algicola sagamiensis TaxID=163869 RepID=UPI0003658B39|nr:NAD(P)-binding protein [Algicola sagamiensis]